MLQRLIPKILILITSSVITSISCDENIARSLSCTSDNESLKYENFKVRFYYSSRKQVHQLLTPNTVDSEDIDYDETRRTVVITHGLTPDIYIEMMNNLRDAFLRWDNVNVIYVDWEEGCASRRHYKQATRNTEYAAIEIKNFFKYLIETWNGTSRSKKHWGPLHFVGISIGAHVVGQAAELLKDGDQPFVFRVTGLEPAEPCFDNVDSPLRMRKSNAQFVDVIHSDVARTLNGGLGLLEPVGHVDFYINGGSSQPGCNLWRKKRDLNYIRLGYHLFFENGRCHHLRSIELFTESLNLADSTKCKFWGHPWGLKNVYTNTPPLDTSQCDETKCIELGINAELYADSGIYYVAINNTPPFCED